LHFVAADMAFVRENWLLILVAFASGAMLVWPLIQRRMGPSKGLATSEAIRLINSRDAVMLDVRDAKELAGGRVPNAVHIPMSDLAARSAEFAKQPARPVIAYCDTGNRSAAAASVLAKAGVTEVYNLNGGFRAWRDAGLPVEKAQ
jgi:rhodanese-related sulfurtransferase